ncbi:MAG: glycosyltransferase family 4 protein [Verrucomicrobiota bacterium]
MQVAFINENTLGHASYLPAFTREFEAHPDLGVQPHLLDVTPLPPALAAKADFTLRGLRKWGLDFHVARWRKVVSRHARALLRELTARKHIDAIVANTQSVALELGDCDQPLFLCLDATFEQLARSGWFAPNLASRFFLPITIRWLRQREQAIFRQSRMLFPWSEPVAQSLCGHYGFSPEKIRILPPSISLPPDAIRPRERSVRPKILFVGGDFRRKGGHLTLSCFRKHFSSSCELHIMTQSEVPLEPGVVIHRNLRPQEPAWKKVWEEADLFVFPSRLETFGIVLLEALAFGVPVISADVGAARFILANGAAGILLDNVDDSSLSRAIRFVLENRETTTGLTKQGRDQIARHFDLATNSAKLANWIRSAM